MRAALFCLATAVLLAAPTATVAAKPAPIEPGTKVMPMPDAVVKMGEQTIDLSKVPVPWIVQNISGEFLLVGDRDKGWVLRSHVLTLEEAPAHYTEIIEHEKDTKKLALAYLDRAVVWRLKGEFDLEIADYGERLRIEPDSLTYFNRGFALMKKRDYDRAIDDFNHAIRLDPGYVRAYDNRGIAWNIKRIHARAIHDFNQAIQLDANYASAYNNAAWLLATCPEQQYRDGRQAIELATKACELTGWVIANHCGTLAAAYAETGDFEAAIKYQTKAIEMKAQNPAFVQAASVRLAMYKEHKPYREQ